MIFGSKRKEVPADKSAEFAKQFERKDHMNPFNLYEKSVQSPEIHIEWLEKVYLEKNGRLPRVLREDFCGSFLVSSLWVKRRKENRAIGLDLDPKVLRYGKRTHYAKLTADQKSRIDIQQANVMSVTHPKADVQVAENFSINALKKFEYLVKYFKCVHQSLSPGGIYIIEIAGGPGMIEETKEKRRFRRNGKKWFSYVWNQKEFNPISHEGLWTISFEFPDGKKLEDVFRYDWRLWSIPELRAAMEAAGFDQTKVYWDDTDEDDDDESGVYLQTEKGDNDHTWIAYVSGHR